MKVLQKLGTNETISDLGTSYSFNLNRIETNVKKPKSKKKAKKTKFKSLKQEALSYDTKTTNVVSPIEVDDDFDDFDDELMFVKKRKKPMEESEVKISKKSKKNKKNSEPRLLDFDSNSLPEQQDEPKDLKLSGSSINLEVDQKTNNRSKMGIKISVISMPVKRVMTIRLEKLKKGSIWPNDCFPTPDSWLSSEDAVLCAVVHEYGVNWSLASDVLYGMTAGGLYRGIVRHPVHCCERYRELVQRYVLSNSENLHNEKSSGKALLRVSEEHAKTLLDIVSEQPDQAYTLQKHFAHLLASVWRSTSHYGHQKNPLHPRSGRFQNHAFRDSIRPQSQNMNFANLSPMRRLVADALDSSENIPREERVSTFSERHDSLNFGHLAITLEFPSRRDDDESIPLPSVVPVSITDSESVPFEHMPMGESHHFRSSKDTVEWRFRDASRVAVDGGLSLPTSALSPAEVKSRPPKSQTPGKQRLQNSELPLKSSKSKSRKTVVDTTEVLSLLRDPNLQPPPMPPIDLTSRFDMASSIPGVVLDDFISTSLLEMGNETFDIVPHVYDPGFTSGLEDCSLSRELTDIG